MDPVFAPVRGFNASYGHLRILCGSLRPPAYFGQTKGALNVFWRYTALRQNEAETKATRSERGGLRFLFIGRLFCPFSPFAV